MQKLPIILCALAVAGNAFGVDGPCVVDGRGHFQIHTGTGGLFGAFAHDHLIEAQKITGCATLDPADLTRSSIKLVFTTAGLRVLDPRESATDRAKIQTNMEMDVLRIAEYPQITFESTGIERSDSASTFRVRGNLTIRGKTQPITLPVTIARVEDGVYRATGEYKFKQTT